MTITLQPIRFHTPVDPEHYTVDNRPLEDIADNLQTIIDALNALNWVNIPFDITFPENGETFSYLDGSWKNVSGGVSIDTVNSLLSTKANTTYSITNSSALDYTVVLTDEYIRRNSSNVNTTNIPLNATVAFPVGYTIHIRQVGTGQSTIVATPGVTILTPETLKLRKIGSIVSITKVDTDTWEIYGDLELV